MLKISKLNKSFGTSGDSFFQPVLKDLDFELEEGEFVSILGPSGSGKSTFLNIIGCLEIPDSGDYLYRGKDILSYSERELDAFRNGDIGFIFQFHHLLPQCNVLENVLLPTLMQKSGRKEKLSYAEHLLNEVKLWEHRHKFPSQLSGGESQRVAVIRAMINKPALLLADEPTGALDKNNAENLADLLQKINQQENVALIMVTHSESLADRASKIFHLEDGKLSKA